MANELLQQQRPDLSFKAQREALAQVAGAEPAAQMFQDNIRSADALLRMAGRNSQPAVARTGGITPEVLAALDKFKNSPIEASIQEGGTGSVAFNGPKSERMTYLTEGFIKRGFTPDQAQALVLNLDDESGLQSAITEAAPNIHGTRGQGLAQLTDIKPGVGRRTDYLNFMSTNGRNDIWSDESQMDYLWWERNNTEKASWDKVAQLQGVGNNASGIVEHVLRPAAEHRIARQKKYLALGY